jgi:hypothetical protein
VPKYEINPLINNKVIASYRKTWGLYLFDLGSQCHFKVKVTIMFVWLQVLFCPRLNQIST